MNKLLLLALLAFAGPVFAHTEGDVAGGFVSGFLHRSAVGTMWWR